MRAARPLLLLALVGLACQSPPPPPAVPAEVSIEILPGFASAPPAPAPQRERVEVLLDVTTSLRAGAPGAEHFRAARRAAARFLARVPAETPVGVRALGLTPGNGCASTTLLGAGGRGSTPGELARQVERLEPAGEGSLAVSIAELRGVLAATGDLAGSRVVVFSDLGSECGGDLCTAAELLLDAGARLDFVVLGDAAAPACLADLAPSQPTFGIAAAPDPPVFRIVAYDPGTAREPFALAEGYADGSRRRVPAGPVTILLGLDPPALIGPLMLSPGTWTHVRVVEFPALDPPVREWVWTTFPIATGGGAP
jgi:hypothetical protein